VSFKIIIHNGKAHLDELLASALLCLHKEGLPSEIIRMDSRDAAELVRSEKFDINTWIIDCGLVHDSSKNLFDHHQDRELPSAASLVFNEYFSHLGESELAVFTELVSRVDTKGPMSLDDYDDINESGMYFTFTQKLLLKQFEQNPLMVVSLYYEGIKDKLLFEKARNKALEWLHSKDNILIETIDNIKVMTYLNKPEEDMIPALRSADSKIIDEENISAVYSYDDKDPSSRILFRTRTGHELLDFTKATPQKTLFCHQGGFLLKFIPAFKNEWENLIKQSISEEVNE